MLLSLLLFWFAESFEVGSSGDQLRGDLGLQAANMSHMFTAGGGGVCLYQHK